ncbi:MAG: DUF885 domain-containing protein [Planctomycetes bacterium]|nr:DUF885 domain-containing protein [Planctomycetota bacterium]
MTRRFTPLLGLLLSLAPAQAQPVPPARALRALLARDHEAQLRESPTWASSQGDLRWDDRLADNSPAGRARWLAHCEQLRDELSAIPRAALDAEEQVNYDLLAFVLEERLRGAPFRDDLLPISGQGGPQLSLPQLPDRLNLGAPARREAFLARLRAMPGYLANTRAQLAEGLALGIVAPRASMQGVVEQLSQAADPEAHPLFAPYAALDADDPQRAAAEAAVAEVAAAFGELRDYVRDVYLPGCREEFAASARPDGPAFYAHELRRHSTLDLGAAAIHALGLKEVARIRAEMLRTIQRTDFANPDDLEGDALFAAFTAYLRTAPRFYHTTPEALLQAYRDVAKRIDGELPRLFRVLPRNSYGVKPLPDYVAERAPTAYYYRGSLKAGRAGNFMANTSHLDQRPTYERIALTLHEAVPGHHLQIALAQELDALPAWRTQLSFSAFTEGWGLYAEKLGLELGEGERGLYADPYDDFGRLSYEMWRALRLVVDTGLHAFGWSRQRAIDFMLQNSALSQTNVEREVDRYIGWPGQAVAYKLGELKLLELRARAEAELGAGFDLRAFHDAVLRGGSLPLPLLERQVEAWIAAGGK